MSERILAVDDHPDALYALERMLSTQGYEVRCASNGADALREAKSFSPSIILLDVMMPQLDGYEVTRELKADSELKFVPIILVTAKDSLEDVVRGLDEGADGYIVKPFKPDELLARVRSALRLRNVYAALRTTERKNEALTREIATPFDFSNIIGESRAMREVFALLSKVVEADSPVLVSGPSGTGKELVARAVHFHSKRSDKPFIAKNCAAFSEQLLESELFGHVKGSFTGALKDKIGLFEAASHGTLFLDEIGEMSQTLQAKLLRVLQDGSFIPVGSTEEVRVDVRVVAATNRDMAKMVEEGTFREDLYYRLNVINVELPTLSERREDIPILVEHFLEKLFTEKGLKRKKLSDATLRALRAYTWKGNVRELENEVERLLILCGDEEEIGPELLSQRIREEASSSPEELNVEPTTLREALESVEKRLITETLSREGGNKSAAAKVLGMSRSNLISKVRQYGIED